VLALTLCALASAALTVAAASMRPNGPRSATRNGHRLAPAGSSGLTVGPSTKTSTARSRAAWLCSSTGYQMGCTAAVSSLVTIGAMAFTIWARLAIRTQSQFLVKMFR
jgi:hypothetical protein